MIKLAIQNDGYVVKGLSAEQLNVLNYILEGVHEKCYQENDDSGIYMSGENYVGCLESSEREALTSLQKGLKAAINRL